MREDNLHMTPLQSGLFVLTSTLNNQGRTLCSLILEVHISFTAVNQPQ